MAGSWAPPFPEGGHTPHGRSPVRVGRPSGGWFARGGQLRNPRSPAMGEPSRGFFNWWCRRGPMGITHGAASALLLRPVG